MIRRRGNPKSDLERVMSHFEVSKDEAKRRLDELSKKLPERGARVSGEGEPEPMFIEKSGGKWEEETAEGYAKWLAKLTGGDKEEIKKKLKEKISRGEVENWERNLWKGLKELAEKKLEEV